MNESLRFEALTKKKPPFAFSGTSAETTLTHRGLWQAIAAEVLSPFDEILEASVFTLGFAMKAKH